MLMNCLLISLWLILYRSTTELHEAASARLQTVLISFFRLHLSRLPAGPQGGYLETRWIHSLQLISIPHSLRSLRYRASIGRVSEARSGEQQGDLESSPLWGCS